MIRKFLAEVIPAGGWVHLPAEALSEPSLEADSGPPLSGRANSLIISERSRSSIAYSEVDHTAWAKVLSTSSRRLLS